MFYAIGTEASCPTTEDETDRAIGRTVKIETQRVIVLQPAIITNVEYLTIDDNLEYVLDFGDLTEVESFEVSRDVVNEV